MTMGCTPSIQPSQPGMLICHVSHDSISTHPSIQGQNEAGRGTPPASTTTGHSNATGAVAATGKAATGKAYLKSASENYSADSGPSKGPQSSMVHLGPMQVHQHTMTVLLVFAREDAQSDAFLWAAERGNYKCNLQRTPEGAVENYLDKHHDLVIIDTRHSKAFDPEALCRSLKATKHSDHTVMLAVTKRLAPGKEEPSVLSMLQTGFTRRYQENADISTCLNELMSLEHGEVRLHVRLRAAKAILTAIENSNDAVEITNEHHRIEYVNPAYERLHGYTCEELAGKDAQDLRRSERNKPDLQECMNSHLRKGKIWEGVYFSQRKGGESFSHRTRTAPVVGHGGEARHFVSIKVPMGEGGSQNWDKFHGDSTFPPDSSLRRGSFELCSFSSDGGFNGNRLRRDSFARIHSMTIEAPITKVINIINSAQESCPNTVVQALDKVLEILRSSELYSPNIGKDDPITNDLVGGLMSREDTFYKNNLKKFSTMTEASLGNRTSSINPPSPAKHGGTIAQMPAEVQRLLEKEPYWDFNVLLLEKLTQRRPLLYLGVKTFERFGVMDFLRIGEKELVSWLQVMETNYHRSNSYHNSTHAADVMHATAYFLSREKCKMVFDKMDEVAALIAAVIHDLDHPGKTNSFLVNDCNHLAILYNDLAVLESHHVSMAFKLTQRDERLNIFKNLDKDEFRAMRQQIVDMVLATEMTKHFEHLNKFISSINQISMKDDEHSSSGGSTTPDSSRARLSQPENKTLIKRMLIKCADVSNPARPIASCSVWAGRIADEYCKQTEDEKAKGLPVVMPIFDKKTCNVPKSQISFIDFFINDMFDAWDSFCDIPILIKHVKENYQYWKDREEVVAREITDRLQIDQRSATDRLDENS